MPNEIYQVDAFTSSIFGGNPAAVCPLENWLPDHVMQRLAAENNLSETAFFLKTGHEYHIRWFTPEMEIDLCGHATLATAHVIFHHTPHTSDVIRFSSQSGILEVHKMDDVIQLNFPSRMPKPAEAPSALLDGFDIAPTKVLKSRDYFLVYDDEKYVRNLVPNFSHLNKLDVVGIIVTAPGREADFVSRFFVPNSVIGEDPVTGSAHCSLIPYWAQEFGKDKMMARQLSAREGQLFCEDRGDRVIIGGHTVLYMKGEYYL
ncbi:PhzF family phenazine biosynthesis protein [Aridibaculum aurantiacum]|uniref:PhzF family phenazine biosynthesis protein n=1 Tax=Aridibaculum aurantiacum TaxID=2810307 RepID=UPI001A95EED3|nr:PhzF family phenazine biosynthesis protein [Aridibaculum aurantiacum]